MVYSIFSTVVPSFRKDIAALLFNLFTRTVPYNSSYISSFLFCFCFVFVLFLLYTVICIC